MKTVLACMLLVLTGVLAAQERQPLAYKFAQGKTYLYKSTMSGSVTQEMMGQEMKMDQGSASTIRILVDRASKESMDLLVSADSSVVSSKSPMRDTTMVLTDHIGKRIKITLSSSGDVLARQVIDSVVMEGPMRGSAQREGIHFPALPETAVKFGDTWNDTKTDTIESMGGKILNTSNTNYTLVGSEQRLGHSCVKITFDGTNEMNGNAAMMGMDLFIEGTGKTTGTIYFDAEQGIAVEVEMSTNTESTMAATGQQQMTIPISQSMKGITRLIE